MSRFLAIAAVAAMTVCGNSGAFAFGGHGGHFAGGHGGFGGHGFGGPVIGLGFAPGYYGYGYGYGPGYGYDPGCYQLQRVWTGHRWVMRQVLVC
jgi:hypothetical protein